MSDANETPKRMGRPKNPESLRTRAIAFNLLGQEIEYLKRKGNGIMSYGFRAVLREAMERDKA